MPLRHHLVAMDQDVMDHHHHDRRLLVVQEKDHRHRHRRPVHHDRVDRIQSINNHRTLL